MYKWYKDTKLTDQRVRQIITVGLPEIILPEHVEAFGIIPFVIPAKPAITNLQVVADNGIEVTETEATQLWRVDNKFDTPEAEQTYLDNIAAQELTAQIEASNKDNLDNDTLISTLKNKTMAEIETDVAAGFSALAGMTDEEIDADINARTTVVQLQNALKILAKDVKWAVKILKIVAKIAVYLIKRAL